MEKILYDQMDWAGIEEIVYSESSDPGRLLGAHVVKEGLLIQAFLPGARTAAVKLGKEKFPMEMADEAGWFAVLFEDKRELEPYRLIAGYEDGTVAETEDRTASGSAPGLRTRSLKSWRLGSITIPMKSWEPIQCLKTGSEAFILQSGRPGPCGSAWWETLICGTEDATR